ncbi:MAG: hypothetical protein EXS08_04075 [Planctomycetes bacterium]|nr:hypothetical protein [Planctomycetota bacterium]
MQSGSRTGSRLLPLCLALVCASWGDGEFDWTRDSILLKDGTEQKGVVIEAWDPAQVVLLVDGGHRHAFPMTEVQRVDKLRDRLASFMGVRAAGNSADKEWQLVEDAARARLPFMARLQAYRVLLLDPEHAGAHQFLGHKPMNSGWSWFIDGKNVTPKKFTELSYEWNSRLVLESEHFVVESDAGLKRALEVLYDLEGLYLWWMRNLAQLIAATEDVDDPRDEKITFLVHRNLESFQPLSRKEPYYDPSGDESVSKGGHNVARTFYTSEGARPEELFELATQALIYSTLVLGKIKGGAPDPELHRSAHWVETGLAHYVALHCGGKPGFPEFSEMLDGTFRLDWNSARRTFETISPPHPLLSVRNELTNLIGLSYDYFVGNSSNIPLCKARCASFVSFLIEADPPVLKGDKVVGHGRAGLWYYFRQVYGTPLAHSSKALDDGFGGGKVEALEDAWKTWVKPFSVAVGTPPPAKVSR